MTKSESSCYARVFCAKEGTVQVWQVVTAIDRLVWRKEVPNGSSDRSGKLNNVVRVEVYPAGDGGIAQYPFIALDGLESSSIELKANKLVMDVHLLSIVGKNKQNPEHFVFDGPAATWTLSATGNGLVNSSLILADESTYDDTSHSTVGPIFHNLPPAVTIDGAEPRQPVLVVRKASESAESHVIQLLFCARVRNATTDVKVSLRGLVADRTAVSYTHLTLPTSDLV